MGATDPRQGSDARVAAWTSYILDNEPMLWNATHRDVHPDPATYDELLEKTIAYASAVRRADPDATIAGPAEWGWLAYHYSAKDVAAGVRLRPDRRLHGDEPLIPWYLRKIREYRAEDRHQNPRYPRRTLLPDGTGGRNRHAGTRPTLPLRPFGFDRPAASGIRATWTSRGSTSACACCRFSVSGSAANHPGLGISIGEWNFGAESHMSGGLATAEALGRFGTEGVTSAYYWTSPKEGSPAFWAFRAFRNFDGTGGHFLDWSVPVKSDGALASLFASRDADRRHIVAVLLECRSSLAALRTRQQSRAVASSRRRARSPTRAVTAASGSLKSRQEGQRWKLRWHPTVLVCLT